jgi:hypothetical protein
MHQGEKLSAINHRLGMSRNYSSVFLGSYLQSVFFCILGLFNDVCSSGYTASSSWLIDAL